MLGQNGPLYFDDTALDLDAKAPIDSQSHWYRLDEPTTGAWQRHERQNPAHIMSHPTVYACATLRANDVAKLPLNLQQRQDTEDGTVWRNIPGSRRPVLRQPNAYQTTPEFFRSWVLDLMIYGNAYIYIKGGQLFKLDGWTTCPQVTQQGELVYSIQRNELAGIFEAKTVGADEIIHDRINPLFHELIGVSPLYAVNLSASQSLTAQQNSTQFFANGARPSGILSFAKKQTQEEADRIQERWKRAHAGQNQGKVAVLSGDVKYEAIGTTAADAQMVEQLELSTQVICEAFHVPPVKLGMEVQNNNSIEAMNLQYYTNAVQADLYRIEKLLNAKLGIPMSQRFQFDDAELLRMDQDTQVNVAKGLADAAVRSPNENRVKFNLPPIEGGEEPFLQEQNFPISDLARDHPKLRQLAAQQSRQAARDLRQADDDNEQRRAAAFEAALAKGYSGAIRNRT